MRSGLLACGLVLTLSAVPCVTLQALPPAADPPDSGAAPPADVTRRFEYDIRASLVILGDLGRVGTLTVEEGLSQADGRTVKTHHGIHVRHTWYLTLKFDLVRVGKPG